MKYCSHCGEQLLDEAVICPGCGSKAKEENSQNPVVSPANAINKKSNKKKLLLIIPAAVLVVVAVLAFMIFRPHDLKMNDFKDNGYIGALFSYGIPTGTVGDSTFIYYNCIKFYGIPVDRFVYEADDSCTMSFYDDDNAYEAYKAIRKHCDLDGKSLGGIFYYYSYKDLRIVVNDDCTYVRIEFR